MSKRQFSPDDHFGSISALPSFLADADIWDGLFSPKARLARPGRRSQLREFLSSHRYGLTRGRATLTPPAGNQRLVLELAMSILERGRWTLPSWPLEQHLAEQARALLGWRIEPSTSAAGDLRLRLQTRLHEEDLINVLMPSPVGCEADLDLILDALCAESDPQSPGETDFLRKVAAKALPAPLLCMLVPQRDAQSMGLGDKFRDQRVDFALETHRGLRLVIEIDGLPHLTNSGQAALDEQRDEALVERGWSVWRVSTSSLSNPHALESALKEKLLERHPDSVGNERNEEITRIFWASTDAARIQYLILQSMLDGAVPCGSPLRVAIDERSKDVRAQAVNDVTELLTRLGRLYGIDKTTEIQLAESADCDLLVDVDVLHPRRPISTSFGPVAWSRPACRTTELLARRIKVGQGSQRFAVDVPDDELLESFIRDLFRKDGFRRDYNGESDQAAITRRILIGKDVVGLLPTGAGKSLPYMLAGLLLPGLTLYVGPLVSLLQDQAERLRETGIDHVQYISSALDQGQKMDALRSVQSHGVRFLLVSPERFLTRPFIEALNKRALWQGDISQVVIDECHCVSEWGHEFRPAYLSLGRIAKDRTRRFGANAPLVALTGTASTIVLSDVLRELGINNPGACIRAANLDRQEIGIRCVRVQFPDKREKQIEDCVVDFLGQNDIQDDGVLIFCPFKGSRGVGVYSVAAHLLRELPGVDVRFYTGGELPWKDYAVFSMRKKADQLSAEEIKAAIPFWGKRSAGVLPWNDVKAGIQREFISGTKKSFRVLVATKAFGMGIDKPSIRKVIHVAPPTSPEAFYQEIGRAGRDRRQSEATLFFCDVEPTVTDKLLDPGRSQPEVRKIYTDFVEANKFGGGDFLRTYYFQNRTFSGKQVGVDAMCEVVKVIEKCLSRDVEPVVGFGTSGSQANDGDDEDEKSIEHALVRLIHLGVVEGYFKNYNKGVFEVELMPIWIEKRSNNDALAQYLAQQFEVFIRRYRLTPDLTAVQRIISSDSDKLGHYSQAATEVMAFIYDHLERQRRQATRQMLELSRVGLTDPSAMRQRLLSYLQVSVRFTMLLEGLPESASPQQWVDLLSEAKSPQELAELHGSSQRVLESFPRHPGLLFLTAVSRSFQQPTDGSRSIEEFDACVGKCKEVGTDLNNVVSAFHAVEQMDFLGNRGLRPLIMDVIGLLYIELGVGLEQIAPYLVCRRVREVWSASIVKGSVDASRLFLGKGQ